MRKVFNVLCSLFLATEPAYLLAGTLTDIAASPYSHLIERAVERGIARGFPDGSFRPDQALAREQMVVMMVGALVNFKDAGLKTPTKPPVDPFKDVSKERWSAASIAFAKQNGLSSGYPDKAFRPGRELTRAEAVIFNRALIAYARRVIGLQGDLPRFNEEVAYQDITGHWASDAIQELSTYCFAESGLSIRDKNFQPNLPASRAFGASILVRSLQCLEAEVTGSSPELHDGNDRSFLDSALEICRLAPGRDDSERQEAIAQIVRYQPGTSELDWQEMASSRDACVEGMLPIAIYLNATTGIPASTIIGQAIQETGWCRSELSRKALNYHGQKAKFSSSLFSYWDGAYVLHSSSESQTGTGENQTSKFMKFSHLDAGFFSMVERLFLAGLPYRSCLEKRSNTESFMECIGKSWAVHRGYADSVLQHRKNYRHSDFADFRLQNCDLKQKEWQLSTKFK